MKYPLFLDPFQAGWLYSRLTDYRDSLPSRDYQSNTPQKPVVDSIIVELTETLMAIRKAES